MLTYRPTTMTPRRPTNHAAPYDLLIRSGEVLDPSHGLRGARDVAFAWGRVAAVAPAGTIDPQAARGVIEAAGCLVTPGLIDLHTHVYVGGSELVIPADEVCSVSGCTTVVDAGTAGANTMLGLRELARSHIRTRVYAFVHISGIGLAGHPHGESRDLLYLDPQLAARCVLSYRGFVLGVKVRQTQGLVGDNGLEPLRRAVHAATLARARLEELSAVGAAGAAGASAQEVEAVPVMVHYGSAPASLAELLSVLRPGDVVTHGYNGGSNGVLDAAGKVESAAREARERGIIWDVGHGRGSFSYQVAKACAEGDFWPDTISTDLHSASVNAPVIDMPTTMSKFLSLGMSLHDVVARSTNAPAAFINRALPPAAREPLLGTLQPGAPGDAAVLDRRHAGGAGGEHTFQDSLGVTWTGPERLIPVHTILGGRPWGRPYPHPYLVP
jgi:dihydroorotase